MLSYINKILSLDEETEAALSGKSFCFTGELYTMKRSEAEALVKKWWYG